MSKNMTYNLTNNYQAIADPGLAKLLELTQRGGEMIPFIGGIPAPEMFPQDMIDQAIGQGDLPLQYSPGQGLPETRSQMAQMLSSEWGREVREEEVLITSGSQQAIDIIGRTFLNPGDKVLVEDPTYFVALYAFSAYNPLYQTIDWKHPHSLGGAKLAYLVPTFSNPTGATLTQIERQVIARLAEEGETIVIEDDPYCELYYGRRPPRPIAALAKKNVLYVTSFSKIVGPAMRVGAIVGEPSLIEALSRVRTGMDLCTSALTQTLVTRIMTDGRFGEHLVRVRKYYAKQARVMIRSLKKYMPRGVSWTHPQGGMFVWITFPERVDTAKLYEKALSAGVAFMPGYIFRPSRERSSSLRLAYSLPTEEMIERGVKILGKLMREEVKKNYEVV